MVWLENHLELIVLIWSGSPYTFCSTCTCPVHHDEASFLQWACILLWLVLPVILLFLAYSTHLVMHLQLHPRGLHSSFDELLPELNCTLIWWLPSWGHYSSSRWGMSQSQQWNALPLHLVQVYPWGLVLRWLLPATSNSLEQHSVVHVIVGILFAYGMHCQVEFTAVVGFGGLLMLANSMSVSCRMPMMMQYMVHQHHVDVDFLAEIKRYGWSPDAATPTCQSWMVGWPLWWPPALWQRSWSSWCSCGCSHWLLIE